MHAVVRCDDDSHLHKVCGAQQDDAEVDSGGAGAAQRAGEHVWLCTSDGRAHSATGNAPRSHVCDPTFTFQQPSCVAGTINNR